MSDAPKLYIAGMGMITPVGGNVEMTAAAVRAGVSAYAISDYSGQNDEPVTMASVPDSVFLGIDADIEEGNRFNERHDRVIKMAIIAIREACSQHNTQQPVPTILAMPEQEDDTEGLSSLIDNLEQNCQPWISKNKCRNIHSGRAAGLEAISFAFRYLHELSHDFILIGGSDSYRDYFRIGPLADKKRLLVTNGSDGFAPGEAAGFILLTRYPQLALEQNGRVIALHPPGIADEPGHLGSEEPYRGDGLDQAFKKAIESHNRSRINSIYSSMNGENHWAKEYGVAYVRNKTAFTESVRIEHPADILGDTGAATATVLLALAADDLFKNHRANTHLVYSSSDTVRRGAILMEKIPAVTAALKRSANYA